MAFSRCRFAALSAAALASSLPGVAGIRTDIGNALSDETQDEKSMFEERKMLLDAIQDRSLDVLGASRHFSEVALSIASDAYKPLMEKADLKPHALLVAGSGGRYEMSTFSDIEYIAVFSGSANVCNKAGGKRNKAGEKQLADLEKVLPKFRVALKKVGLESDRLNQPTARKGSVACSPDVLVSSLLMGGDEVLTSMLLESTFMAGEESVAAEVREAVKRWMATPKEQAVAEGVVKISKKREILADVKARTLGDWVRGKLDIWKYSAKMDKARTIVNNGFDQFDIKATLYRPLQTVLFMEALGAPTEKNSAFNAIEKLDYLQQSGKMTSSLHDQVKEALNSAVRVRMLSHAQAGQEQDMACLECIDTMGFSGFQVPDDLKENVRESAAIVGCILDALHATSRLPSDCSVGGR